MFNLDKIKIFLDGSTNIKDKAITNNKLLHILISFDKVLELHDNQVLITDIDNFYSTLKQYNLKLKWLNQL
jgi:hypothetical protein